MELVPLILYWARFNNGLCYEGANGGEGRREEEEWRLQGERASRQVASKPREGDGQGFNSLLRLGKPYHIYRPTGRMFPFKLLNQPTPLHYNLIKNK